MTTPTNRVARLLAQARQGSREALGELLEGHRDFLQHLAERELDPDLRAKGGASDLVQQTFLEAQRDIGQFRGQTDAELAGWLRQMLLNNLASFSRRFRDTGKRHLGCEVSLEDSREDEGGLRAVLADSDPGPLEKAMREENLRLLREALERLPPDDRELVQLRFWDELPFEEIGQRLQRSPDGVRKVFKRVVERLSDEMNTPGE